MFIIMELYRSNYYKNEVSEAEILYIWKKEHNTSFVEIMIKKFFC
jgi:hypothetical protein